ncbi:MAG: hypothetical protein K2X66_17950 [Cyanobacteria bacterium]|nr:hypothetical protein [Cyanobacteriota bacterium]
MDTRQLRSSRSITLTREDLSQSPEAFESKSNVSNEVGGFSRVIASSFLKYSEEAMGLDETEDVESFIKLYHLHQELMASAESFLEEELPFIQDNCPINEILLNFATYRLTKASRAFYFECLTIRDPQSIEALKTKVKQYQTEVDNLLQTL